MIGVYGLGNIPVDASIYIVGMNDGDLFGRVLRYELYSQYGHSSCVEAGQIGIFGNWALI